MKSVPVLRKRGAGPGLYRGPRRDPAPSGRETEGKQKNPNYREVCRRYLADEVIFLKSSFPLRIGKRFSNTDLEACLEEILKEMESH